MGKAIFNWKVVFIVILCSITFFVNNRVVVPDIMESRNIVTAREMVYDGNWIVPTMNGDLRLEKPPLPTWITAIAEIISPDSLALQRGMAGIAATMLVLFFFFIAKEFSDKDDLPLVSTLILTTCYNIILIGRTASWDIYCHAFMLGAIYFLIKAFNSRKSGKFFISAGIFMGLSCMSKGPVSFYALLLPFIISYYICFTPSMKGKWKWVLYMVILAIIIGGWWYSYIYIFHHEDMNHVANKEAGAWLSRSVRPWYYYWKFFLETGIWSLLLLSAIFLPFWSRKSRSDKSMLFPYLWMFLTLIFLSLLPEKKSRYLLPILISASYLCGYLVVYWNELFKVNRSHNLDKIAYSVNAWLIAIIVILLPAPAYYFVYANGYISLPLFILISMAIEVIGYLLVKSASALKPNRFVMEVTALFLFLEAFVLPFAENIINNPEMDSVSKTRKISEIKSIPFYHNSKDDLRIELVYAANKKIRPLDVANSDSVMNHLPMVLLTHKSASDELPDELLQKIDTVYIGKSDDNRWSKSDKRYKEDFVYNITLLKKR